MSEANKRQVGGDHYQAPVQAWDFIHEHQLSYLEGCVVKYLSRFEKKGTPIQDLNKALHYIEKIEETDDGKMPMGRGLEFKNALEFFAISNRILLGDTKALEAVLMRVNSECTTKAKNYIQRQITLIDGAPGWLAAQKKAAENAGFAVTEKPANDERVICGVFPHGHE